MAWINIGLWKSLRRKAAVGFTLVTIGATAIYSNSDKIAESISNQTNIGYEFVSRKVEPEVVKKTEEMIIPAIRSAVTNKGILAEASYKIGVNEQELVKKVLEEAVATIRLEFAKKKFYYQYEKEGTIHDHLLLNILWNDGESLHIIYHVKINYYPYEVIPIQEGEGIDKLIEYISANTTEAVVQSIFSHKKDSIKTLISPKGAMTILMIALIPIIGIAIKISFGLRRK